MDYIKHMTRAQSEPLPDQVENSAGGFSYQASQWDRLRRFLILGAEGGTYYVGERKLTQENAQVVLDCHREDARKTIATITEVSERGLAPKNDPAIFALGLLSSDPRALAVMPRVCRTGTHLFQFINTAKSVRGWGRALKRTIEDWYIGKTSDKLAYQLAKYQQRDGWSHRDVLRLAHPIPVRPFQREAFKWATGRPVEDFEGISVIEGMERAKVAATSVGVASLIREFNLPRECVPTKWLKDPEIWEALLESMPAIALLRNLGKMGSIDLLKPLSDAENLVCEKIRNISNTHPIQVLLSLTTYASGKGVRGSLTWNPSASVIAALNDAFYAAFESIEPTGKRHLLAIDVSGSMDWGKISGTHISAAVGSAAMAMATIKTEPRTRTMAFSHQLMPLPIHSEMSLETVCGAVSQIPMGATDCSLPMLYALKNDIDVDVFVVYTDSETWYGQIHPAEALRDYRRKKQIPAKLIVMGMCANKFTIADPKDSGMLDVVGLDGSVPSVMRDFILQ